METVILQTGDGGFVARSQITPFRGTPDIVQWNEKYFKFAGLYKERGKESIKIYRETEKPIDGDVNIVKAV